MNTIGDKIKIARLKKNLTQPQLARLLGTSSSYVSQLETGYRIPASDTLVGLAASLGISISYLLEDKIQAKKESQSVPSDLLTTVEVYAVVPTAIDTPSNQDKGKIDPKSENLPLSSDTEIIDELPAPQAKRLCKPKRVSRR